MVRRRQRTSKKSVLPVAERTNRGGRLARRGAARCSRRVSIASRPCRSERWVSTVRRECLDHLLIVGARHRHACSTPTSSTTTPTGRTDPSASYYPNHGHGLPGELYRPGRMSAVGMCSVASSTNMTWSRDVISFWHPTCDIHADGRPWTDAPAQSLELHPTGWMSIRWTWRPTSGRVLVPDFLG